MPRQKNGAIFRRRAEKPLSKCGNFIGQDKCWKARIGWTAKEPNSPFVESVCFSRWDFTRAGYFPEYRNRYFPSHPYLSFGWFYWFRPLFCVSLSGLFGMQIGTVRSRRRRTVLRLLVSQENLWSRRDTGTSSRSAKPNWTHWRAQLWPGRPRHFRFGTRVPDALPGFGPRPLCVRYSAS